MDKKQHEISILLQDMGKGITRIGVSAPHDWRQLAYMMEALGVFAYNFIGNNPKNIDNAEDLAQYICEYITNVLITADVREDKTNETK